MANVRQALRDALGAKEWTVGDLLVESRLSCDRSSLHRKLFGYRKGGKRIYQRLTFEECHKLARALDVSIELGGGVA